MTAERGRPSEALLMRLLLAFAIAVSSASLSVADEKPGEIPLKEVWALNMPGTKDVNELDPYDGDEPTAVTKINRVFFTKMDEETPPGKCFIVPGVGEEALKNAADVLVCNEPRPKGVPLGDPASLVFYSHPAPGYVQLDSIELSGALITINYRVAVHDTANVTAHFALIPLRDLSEGKYAVKLNQVAAKGTRVAMPDPKRTERAVCDPCSFLVVRERKGVRNLSAMTRQGS
jgi:hypothetical protein